MPTFLHLPKLMYAENALERQRLTALCQACAKCHQASGDLGAEGQA